MFVVWTRHKTIKLCMLHTCFPLRGHADSLECRKNCKSLHSAGSHSQRCWNHTSAVCFDLPPSLSNSDIANLWHRRTWQQVSARPEFHPRGPSHSTSPGKHFWCTFGNTLSHFPWQRCDHISFLSGSPTICGSFMRNSSGRMPFACLGSSKMQNKTSLIDTSLIRLS